MAASGSIKCWPKKLARLSAPEMAKEAHKLLTPHFPSPERGQLQHMWADKAMTLASNGGVKT